MLLTAQALYDDTTALCDDRDYSCKAYLMCNSQLNVQCSAEYKSLDKTSVPTPIDTNNAST